MDAFSDMPCQDAIVPLTNGGFAIVDYEDLGLIENYNWVRQDVRAVSYAYCTVRLSKKKTKTFYMHRLIMDAPDHLVVDHLNHNGLDNRRANLRVCTQSQNLQNRPRTRAYYTKRFKENLEQRRAERQTAKEAA